MKPARERVTSVVLVGAADLVLAPRIKGVVHGQRERELPVVTEVQQMEALGNGEQAA